MVILKLTLYPSFHSSGPGVAWQVPIGAHHFGIGPGEAGASRFSQFEHVSANCWETSLHIVSLFSNQFAIAYDAHAFQDFSGLSKTF